MNVTFYGDGQGKWLRRDWAEQCPEKVLLLHNCQGVKGHSGDHWHYSPDGFYHYGNNDKENPEPEYAAGMIPPDNEGYKHPQEMQEHRYRSHHVDTEVTDTEELDRLNRGDFREDESIDMPVPPDELEKLKEEGILPEDC